MHQLPQISNGLEIESSVSKVDPVIKTHTQTGRSLLFLLFFRGHVILEMLVQVLMVFVLFILAHGGGPFLRRLQIGLPRRFRTDRAQGDELLQILLVARRAFRRGGRGEK